MGQLVGPSSTTASALRSPGTTLVYVMWWNTNRPPTVLVAPLFGTSLTSRTSTADAYRSSVRPLGINPRSVHLSGPTAGTATSTDFSTRSGSPIVHLSVVSNWRGGGMLAGFPWGAPLSTHLAIFATSASPSEGSFLNF